MSGITVSLMVLVRWEDAHPRQTVRSYTTLKPTTRTPHVFYNKTHFVSLILKSNMCKFNSLFSYIITFEEIIC